MFIDTHCHLNIMVEKERESFLSDEHLRFIQGYIDQAMQAGVETIINVGTSLVESKNSLMLAQQFDSVYATLGVHPCDTNSEWKKAIVEFKKILKEDDYAHKVVGIGETGLDFYHKPFDRLRQQDAFKAHIELALETKRALVIHVRESADEVLTILEPYHKEELKAVIHCFAQKKDFADIVTSWGLYVGIDAPITYPKNQWLRDVIATIDPKHIILETDSPFLPPQQYRGKKNFPAYIPLFASVLAELLSYSLEEIASVTTRNARALFNIGGE